MCLVEIFQQIVGGDKWAAAGGCLDLDTLDTDAMYSHTDWYNKYMLHCVLWGESILSRPRSMCWLYKCTLSVRRVKKHESWGVLSVIVRRVCSAECWVWRLIVAADWDWGAALVTNTIYTIYYLHYLQRCCVQQDRGVQINLIVSHLILYLLWISLIRPWI